MSVGVDALIAEWRKERAERQQRDRAEHFASGDPIPDLELMPPCPICDGALVYDDGFACYGCNVQWDRCGTEGRVIE